MDLRAAAFAIAVVVGLTCSAAPAQHPDVTVHGQAEGAHAVHARSGPFPVGQSLISDHKVATGNPVWVTPDEWTTVEAMTIPAGGHYIVTVQVRLPRRAWAEFRLARHGWGHDADGMDETGYHVFQARPDGRRTSDSFTHAIMGGGPIDFQIRLHLDKPSPDPLVAVPTFVGKAHRTD